MAGEAGAAVTRFGSKADSYVSAANRQGNFGQAPVLQVRGRPAARSYVRFQIAGLPGTVTRATLELVARSSWAQGLTVQAAGSGWTERGTRYRTAPRPRGPAIRSGRLKAGSIVRIDVTRLVTGDGSITFVLTSRGRGLIKLASREGAAAARPRLLVTTNAAPVCSALTLAAVEDTSTAVAPGCRDADGDALNVSLLTQPSKGSASLVNGNLQYSPAANVSGSDSFVFRADDGRAASTPTSVSVSIRAVNDGPTCEARALTVSEDGAGAVAVACSDVDGDALTYSILSQALKGTASVVGGELRYAPNPDVSGTDTFSYRARDGSVASAATAVSVTIEAVNDPPVCATVSMTINEDASADKEPSCTDPDGNPLTYAIVSQPVKGAASVVGGKLRYAPAANANGADNFTYRASDATATSAPATVTVSVTAVNDAPVCSALVLGTAEDTSATVTPSCSDLDNDALTYEIASQGTKGTASITPQGLRYVPAPNLNGADSFTYAARDGSALSAAATVEVTINTANDPPVCSAVSIVANEDSPADTEPSCTDPEGNSMTYSIASQPSKGAASVVGGKLHYVPAANVNGSDTFTYRASDGVVTSASASVSVTIGAANDAPVCAGVVLQTAEDTTATVAPSCTDLEGNALSYEIVSAGTKGTASVIAQGLQYAPALNANGSDTFTYRANDGDRDSAPATVSVTISGVNDPPACAAVTLTLPEDSEGSLTPACSDPEGQALTYSPVSDPEKGMVWEADGAVMYAPLANQNGTDSFTYRATDGSSPSAPAAVSVTISAVNDAPEAMPQVVSTDENVSKAIDLEGFDEDGDAVTFAIESLPADGRLYKGNSTTGAPIAAGSLPFKLGTGIRVTYVPNAGFSGSDLFQFTAFDTTESSIPADVSIDVEGLNNAPVCTALSVSVDEDGELWGEVCSDADGDEMTFVRSGPSHGSLELFEDGRFNYVPHANYSGPDSFTVTATDPSGAASSPAAVSITVVGASDAPVCRPVPLGTAEDTANSVLPDCEDADGQSMTYSIVTQATKGVASITATGRLRYVPGDNEHGTDSFTYAASDGALTSAGVRVDVQVSPVNDRPICRLAAISTTVGTVGTTFPDCEDVDGDLLTYQIGTQPTMGVASFSGGMLRYQPTGGVGGDSFTYRAKDATLFSLDATVNVTVSPS